MEPGVSNTGAYEIVGRADDLIIREARNIDPSEVERAFEDHPLIGRASDLGIPSRMAAEMDVTAVLEVIEGAQIDVAEIRSWYILQVATRNVPRRIRVVDAIPLAADQTVRRGEIRRWFMEDPMNFGAEPGVAQG